MLEKFAMARLKAFSLDRAKTDTQSTSRLSPHVHYGEISVRHIYYVVRPTDLYKLGAHFSLRCEAGQCVDGTMGTGSAGLQ